MKEKISHREMSVTLDDKAHLEVETEGYKRLTATDKPYKGRVFIIQPGGIRTDKGWEHSVVEPS